MTKNHWLGGAIILAAGMAIWTAAPQNGAQAAEPSASATDAGGNAPLPAPRQKTDQVRGFSIQLFDSTQAGAENYIKAIDQLADMGCTWLNFSIAARQDNIHSEGMSLNDLTIPSKPNLERILRHAKDRHMGVMLMPIVLLNNAGPKDWRGVINPNGDHWDNWFGSYAFYIKGMAAVAQSCGVDIFCVGSELLSTEPFRDRWTDVIAQIRMEYHGKLTYSANWDHYENVTFWDQLDYIGMNNYNELASKPGVPVPQLVAAWDPIKKKILDFAAKQNKPFFFTEVGWHNLVNTVAEPWNYVATGEINLDEQTHAFQSFVQTWQSVPHDKFMGAFVWEWCPGVDGRTVHGTYSLQNTDALKVVQKWMIAP